MNIKKILNIVAIIITILLFFSGNKLSAVAFILLYALYTNYPTILYYIGSNRQAKNDLKKAELFYREAYRAKNSSMRIKTSYAYFLLSKGDLKEADKVLKELLKNNLTSTDEINVKLNYSLVLWKRNELDKAIELLMDLYQRYKTIVIYQNLGFFMILKGDYDKAIEINLEAYEYDSSNGGILDNLAQNYFLVGEYENAFKIYDELMQKKPTFASAYYNYALILLKVNRNEEALENLKQALNCKFSFLSTVPKAEIEAKIDEAQKLLQ
jgi:tetratricopeptide (TPR) repeat protein